jgi:hypothetical protein
VKKRPLAVSLSPMACYLIANALINKETEDIDLTIVSR